MSFSVNLFLLQCHFIMATGSSQAKVFSIEPKDMPSAPKLTGKFYNSTINNDGSERNFGRIYLRIFLRIHPWLLFYTVRK